MLLYQILASTIHGKTSTTYMKIINLKYQLQLGIMNLNYLMDLVQIFKLILSISSKKNKAVTNNLSIRICVKKTENKITFKIVTAYYLKLSMPETITLLGSTKNNAPKDENGKMYLIYKLLK